MQPFQGFDGSSISLENFRTELRQRLATASVLILVGESGCGKSYAAHQIFSETGRREHLVAITDTKSLADALVSPLCKGILIEEIGAQPPSLQAVLRQWIEHEFYSAGSQARACTVVDQPHMYHHDSTSHSYPLVIVTSSWSSVHLVRDRKLDPFLADWMKKNTVYVPSFRDRADDLELLSTRWLQEDGALRVFDAQCYAWIRRQEWSENFRQVRHFLHCVATHAKGTRITLNMLLKITREHHLAPQSAFRGLLSRLLLTLIDFETEEHGALHARVLAEVERPLFEMVLKATEGNQLKAAALLGLNRNTLRKRLQALGIVAGRVRP